MAKTSVNRKSDLFQPPFSSQKKRTAKREVILRQKITERGNPITLAKPRPNLKKRIKNYKILRTKKNFELIRKKENCRVLKKAEGKFSLMSFFHLKMRH